MFKALTISAAIFLLSSSFGWLPWDAAGNSFSTLMAATLLIVAASLLVSALITVDRRELNSAYSPLIRPLLGCLILLAALVVLKRFTGTVHVGLTLGISALMVSAASLLGVALARGLRRSTELIPVCVVAAWADLCSLTSGPTHVMAEQISAYYSTGQQGMPPLVDELLIKTLVPGSALPVPLFGVTDWIIVAFLSAALVRLELSPGFPLPGFDRGVTVPFKHLHVASLGLWSALVVAHLSGRFVPGLVLICAAVLAWVLIRHPQSRCLSRRELLLTGLFPLLMTLGVTLL